jgi:hypothetical protein
MENMPARFHVPYLEPGARVCSANTSDVDSKLNQSCLDCVPTARFAAIMRPIVQPSAEAALAPKDVFEAAGKEER